MANTYIENIANAICAWLKYSETQINTKTEIWDVTNPNLTALLKAFTSNYGNLSKSDLEHLPHLVNAEGELRPYLATTTPPSTSSERWNAQFTLFWALVECELYIGKTICTNKFSLKDLKRKLAH